MKASSQKDMASKTNDTQMTEKKLNYTCVGDISEEPKLVIRVGSICHEHITHNGDILFIEKGLIVRPGQVLRHDISR